MIHSKVIEQIEEWADALADERLDYGAEYARGSCEALSALVDVIKANAAELPVIPRYIAKAFMSLSEMEEWLSIKAVEGYILKSHTSTYANEIGVETVIMEFVGVS